MMARVSKELEIRDSRKARFLGTVGGWLGRVLSWTLRIEVQDRCGVTDRAELQRPLIWCLWHNRVLGMAVTRRRYFGWREGVVLTSASHDEAALAAAARVFGAGAARGSSSRRGAAAMRELLRVLKAGKDVVVTPDGPRGPRYRLQGGVLKAAQAAGAPVLAFHVRFGGAWRLRTWDRFVIPRPFSRVTIVFDELLDVPRRLDEDGFEERRRQLEETMRRGVDDLELESDEED